MYKLWLTVSITWYNMSLFSYRRTEQTPTGSDNEERTGAVCAGPAEPLQLSVWAGKEKVSETLIELIELRLHCEDRC